MKYDVLTLFPELVETMLGSSITGRAMAKGLITLECINMRDFAPPERKSRVDDYPFGGGAGMVIQPEPVYESWRYVAEGRAQTGRTSPLRTIYLTPQGKTFNQQMAIELAQEEELCFLCGHYEGIDERVLEEIVTDEISIGDYVLTGGELPAAVVMDAISRMVPGVLSNEHSGEDESFMNSLLEYPQYTRPAVWHGVEVPAILLSGHHANVDAWRRQESIRRTFERRPELLDQAVLSKKEKAFLETLRNEDDIPEPDLSRKNT